MDKLLDVGKKLYAADFMTGQLGLGNTHSMNSVSSANSFSPRRGESVWCGAACCTHTCVCDV